MSETRITNAKRIALALQKNGVKYLFGQSNPFSVTLACEDIGIEQIGYRQENAGSYMAQAYAMCTNTVAVVTAQNGPAATLLVPGLAEAFKSSYPLVAIVEDVARSHEEKNAFQELDHLELFKGVSKWTKRIVSEEQIEHYIDRAFLIAASGRPGPTVLLCPKDIINDLKEYAPQTKSTQNYGRFPLDRPVGSDETLKEAARLLATAKQPFIYAGGGVISANAIEEIRTLQELYSIPVATTTMGKGSVNEQHPLSIGPIGYYMGNRGVSKHLKPYIEQADVILLVGNRTNQNGTDSWSLLPQNAKYIHIDIDPTEIGRNYDSLRILGDAKTSLKKLIEFIGNEDLSLRNQTKAPFEHRIKKSRQLHDEELAEIRNNENAAIKMEKFLYEANKLLEKDHIIAVDASFASVWAANYLEATDDRKFLFPRGLAGLGWGLPYAMGAKVANPDRKVFCIVGDGGFAHVWSELETCKRLNLNVVIVVINNGILGYQMLTEKAQVGRYTNVCEFSSVDHTKISEACGIKGIRVEAISEIVPALEQAFSMDESVVIDLVTDPNNIPPVTTLSVLEH